MNSNDYVELERTFQDVIVDPSRDDVAIKSYTRAADAGTSLSWKELLAERLVVILGEPGSGKTRELQQRVRQLRQEEQFAFFVPLERLRSQTLEAVLGPEEFQRFGAWQRSSKEGVVVLDSVDESKLDRPSDFYAALAQFRNAVKTESLSRAHILISSRIREWMPEADKQEVRDRLLPPGRSVGTNDGVRVEGATPVTVRVVQIDPLDRARVEVFAMRRGLSDVETFIAALDRSHAWEFARRPADVIDLIEFWQNDHRIGSLSELIAFSVRRKLKETPAKVDRDPLSEEDAIRGAETLAAATMFCRTLAFKVPDFAPVAGGIDPQAVLPSNWTAKKCQALLDRALFDVASYGLQRFHHRRVSEYLAAEWIRRRVRDGCEINRLEDLLFEQIEGRRILRPSLAPVTAWLCAGSEPWTTTVRSWVVDAAPEIHLQSGDPAALPLDYKALVLRRVVESQVGRARTWINTDDETLGRIADERLADELSKIIADSSVALDLRGTMLEVAQRGNVTQCLDVALNIVADSTCGDSLKHYAVRMIDEIGTAVARRRLADISAGLSDISPSLCGMICDALFPETIDTGNLIALLKKVPTVARDVVGGTYTLQSLFETKLTPTACGELLPLLIDLATVPPCDDESGLSHRFWWVGRLIPVVVARMLEKSELTSPEVADIAGAIKLVDSDEREWTRRNVDLDAASRRHPNVRRALFWQLLSEQRARNESEPRFLNMVFGHRGPISAAFDDFAWLIEDVQCCAIESDRQIALALAIDLWATMGYPRREGKLIANATRNVPLLRRRVRELVPSFPKIRRFWYRNVHSKWKQTWWRDQQWYKVQRTLQWWRGEINLHRHLNLLSSGRATNWLPNLIFEANEKDGHNRWTPQSWSALRRDRGPLVVWAVKRGCKRSWRLFSPTLPHERQNPNSTDNRVIIGLAGIKAALDDSELNLERVSGADAELLTRYAINELNGFAPWFDALVQAHSVAVSKVLESAIAGEWLFDADRTGIHEVTYDLVWHGEKYSSLVAPAIVRRLTAGDPANATILRFALSIVIRHDPRSLQSIAQHRVRLLPFGSPSFILWWSVLVQLDAAEALDVLEQHIASFQNAEPGLQATMVSLCAALGGRFEDYERLPRIADPDYLKPAHMARLIPIVYEFIRPANDINRVDMGSFTPDVRDAAQDFRDGLLTRLSASEEPAAVGVLRALIQNPAFASVRDWNAHAVDLVLGRLADGYPWEAENVRTFERDYEADPRTDRDLASIARRRLVEIKYDVERADNSLRDEIHVDHNEAAIRRWLQRKLIERSRDRYTVPQEEEIDLRQRPDLRLENPKTGPVSIEIKRGEEWSAQELLDGLEQQLVGQYLRAHKSRYGIYVVSLKRDKEWDDPSGGPGLDFPALVSLLTKRATEIQRDQADVDGLEVIAIDFRDPRGTGGSHRRPRAKPARSTASSADAIATQPASVTCRNSEASAPATAQDAIPNGSRSA